MSASRVFVVSCLVVAMFVMAVPSAKAALTCGQVVNRLTPCIDYLLNTGELTDNCCGGIKGLYSMAKSTIDRQQVCKCLKTAVANYPISSYSLGLAQGLPDKCGVKIPYKIDPKTDCSKVK